MGKKIMIAAVAFSILILISGCSIYDDAYDRGYDIGWQEGYEMAKADAMSEIEGLTENSINPETYLYENALDYVYDRYGLADILSEYEDRMGRDNYRIDFRDYVFYGRYEYPDIELILDEIECQGKKNLYNLFFQITDEIGYNPSALLGLICLDEKTGVLHSSNGACVKQIPLSRICFLGIWSFEDLKKDIEESPDFWGNRSICNKCLDMYMK